MRIINSLTEYLALTQQEKLGAYLVEDEAATVTTVDDGSPLVDVRTLEGSGLLMFHPTVPDFRMRPEAGKRLIAAAAALQEKGYGLEVMEMFRSYEKQKREFDEIFRDISLKFPQLEGKELWRKVTEFIADPDLCPPHATGGATDIRLRSLKTGELVSMGTELNAIDAAAYLMDDSIPADCRDNRLTLMQCMIDAGFAPMPTEWWHYSFGEKYWGAYYRKDAIFGTVR